VNCIFVDDNPSSLSRMIKIMSNINRGHHRSYSLAYPDGDDLKNCHAMRYKELTIGIGDSENNLNIIFLDVKMNLVNLINDTEKYKIIKEEYGEHQGLYIYDTIREQNEDVSICFLTSALYDVKIQERVNNNSYTQYIEKGSTGIADMCKEVIEKFIKMKTKWEI